jgi:glycosyltransferase involved in cell wall biosynthesis
MQDSGEAAIGPLRAYVRRAGAWLMRMADGYVVHSSFDRAALERSFPVGERPVRVVRHGPYSHYPVAESEPLREAPAGACNVLFFGTIRPYKGLEDLVRAFELIAAERNDCWLTVVGETWEGWSAPLELIAMSSVRERITLVNRYVTDGDAARWFAGADVVALPYRRSSASGPLHMTMDAGLPVVVGDVGGLAEACSGYGGAVLVPAADPAALAEGLRRAIDLGGRRFACSGSWGEAAEAVLALAEA